MQLDIEAIKKGSEDYKEIETTKAENNPKYSLADAKAQLGLQMIVEIDSKALKDLTKIHTQEVKKIFSKIELLENYPNISNIKKLTNFEPPFIE